VLDVLVIFILVAFFAACAALVQGSTRIIGGEHAAPPELEAQAADDRDGSLTPLAGGDGPIPTPLGARSRETAGAVSGGRDV
jgi:hypothetical protein